MQSSASRSPHPRRSQPWLWLILLLYALAGAAYAVAAPPLEVSDEPRHYAMVEWLAQGHGLPVQRLGQGDADAPYGQEGSQPPLYYALMALVAQPFDRSDYPQVWRFNPHTQSMGRADATANRTQMLHTPDQVFPWHGTVLAVMVMRLLGVLMGGVTVVCTYGLARELIVGKSRPVSSIPLLAAALTAFNPMFLHIMASVNNDTLATMLSAVALGLGARLIRRGATVRHCVLLGVVLGGAALTKASGLALVGVVPFFVGLAEWRSGRAGGGGRGRGRGGALRLLLTALLWMIVPAIAIAGWWYGRNAVLYGDLTGTAMMAQIAGPRVPPLNSLFELVAEERSFFTAYWGMFGALNIPLSDWVYPALEVLWLVAGAGLVWAAIDGLASLGKRRLDTNGLLALFQFLCAPRVLIGLMAFSAIAVAFVALLRWSSLTLASQGRLLFPVIAAVSTFTAIGITQIATGIDSIASSGRRRSSVVGRLSDGLAVLMITALAALALATPFTTIAPAYARPRLLSSEAQLPSNLVRTELTFAGQIRWLGYVAEPARVHPGEILNVTLYWQALQPISKDYSLGLRLFGRGTGETISDTELLVLDTYPGGGMWQTTLWKPGQIVADHYQLRIPAMSAPTVNQLLPSVLKLDVGFYELNGFQFITDTRDAQGQPSGRQRYAIASLGASQPQALDLAAGGTATGPHLEQAKLLEATATLEAGPQGRRIRFATRWQATANFGEDYTMFVQLWDKDAVAGTSPITQADGPTQPLPVRWWQAGDVIEDVRYLEVPADAPAGPVIIKFGLYKPVEPYERMPAFYAANAPLPDRALQVELNLN